MDDVTLKLAEFNTRITFDAVLAIRGENDIDADRIDVINVYNSEVVNVQCGFDYTSMGPLQAQI
jgi:hypothetical protein